MLNEELKQKLYDTGYKYEESYGGCCQCVLAQLNKPWPCWRRHI